MFSPMLNHAQIRSTTAAVMSACAVGQKTPSETVPAYDLGHCARLNRFSARTHARSSVCGDKKSHPKFLRACDDPVMRIGREYLLRLSPSLSQFRRVFKVSPSAHTFPLTQLFYTRVEIRYAVGQSTWKCFLVDKHQYDDTGLCTQQRMDAHGPRGEAIIIASATISMY